MDKAPEAFRTISEVADDLDVPQHVLRFWETRFSQIKPMKRSGGRRYYRPDDIDLLRGIRRLLYGEGYTIRGVQRILKENGIKAVQALGDGAALPARQLAAVGTIVTREKGKGTRVAPRVVVPRADEADGIAEDDADAGADEFAGDEGAAEVGAAADAADRDEASDDDAADDDAADDDADIRDEAVATARPAAPPASVPSRFGTRAAMATPLLPNHPARGTPAMAPPASRSAAPGAATSAATASAGVPSAASRNALDLIRLKAALHDLVACREMIDRALADNTSR